MKGQQSLFKDLFQNQPASHSDKQRPRNYFQPERNECLCYRYYFHAEINRLRYDDCIHELEKEFYLTSVRIVNVLSENNQKLKEIAQQKPAIKEMQSLYPHMNWKRRFNYY